MKKLSATLALALLLAVPAFSQGKYMLEIKNDAKTIHASELGLPESATLTEVLSLLPELLSRPKLDVLTNYNIQINGFNLGGDKEPAMTMLHISDISSITITESSVDSYTSKGTGGTINISLKELKEGFSGGVDLMAYTIPQVSPTVHLGYKKDKFKIRGLFGFSTMKANNYIVDRVYEYTGTPLGALSGSTYTGADTTTLRTNMEIAHVIAEYAPTAADLVSLKVSQSYDMNGSSVNGYLFRDGFKEEADKETKSKNLNLSVEAMYRHTFAKYSNLKFQFNYSGQPTNSSSDISFLRELTSDSHSGSFAGKIDFTHSFRDAGEKETANLNVGVNANRGRNYAQHEEEMHLLGMTQFSRNSYTTGITSYFSPYAQFETLLGQFRIKAKADYQYYHYDLMAKDKADFNTWNHNFTFKLMLGWQLADHHHLRLFLDRKIRRPSTVQMYPVVLYSPSALSFAKGNPDLAPEQIHEASLDYITDIKTAGGGYFVVNANVAYIRVDDRIRQVPGDKESEKHYPYDFISFANAGYTNILNTDLMFYYRKGIFNLSVTGNLYVNYDVNGDSMDHYNYYSLSVYPSFHFKNDWRTSMQLVYYSPVSTRSSSLGHSASANLYVGKTWNRLSVGLAGSLQLIKRTTDIIHGAGDQVTRETYIPGYNYVALNFNYRF